MIAQPAAFRKGKEQGEEVRCPIRTLSVFLRPVAVEKTAQEYTSYLLLYTRRIVLHVFCTVLYLFKKIWIEVPVNMVYKTKMRRYAWCYLGRGFARAVFDL